MARELIPYEIRVENARKLKALKVDYENITQALFDLMQSIGEAFVYIEPDCYEIHAHTSQLGCTLKESCLALGEYTCKIETYIEKENMLNMQNVYAPPFDKSLFR